MVKVSHGQVLATTRAWPKTETVCQSILKNTALTSIVFILQKMDLTLIASSFKL